MTLWRVRRKVRAIYNVLLGQWLNVPATVKLVLEVHYTDDYPDTLPELSLEPLKGSIEEDEIENLLADLRRVVCQLLPSGAIHAHLLKGEENLGMAMTFTLASQLREQLSDLLRSRAEQRQREEMEKERRAIEVRLRVASVDGIILKSH